MGQEKVASVMLTKREVEDFLRYAIVNGEENLEARLREALRTLIKSDLEDAYKRSHATPPVSA